MFTRVYIRLLRHKRRANQGRAGLQSRSVKFQAKILLLTIIGWRTWPGDEQQWGFERVCRMCLKTGYHIEPENETLITCDIWLNEL